MLEEEVDRRMYSTLVRERGDAEARVAQLKKGAGGQSSEADGSFAQSLKAARRTYRALQATWFQQGQLKRPLTVSVLARLLSQAQPALPHTCDSAVPPLLASA